MPHGDPDEFVHSVCALAVLQNGLLEATNHSPGDTVFHLLVDDVWPAGRPTEGLELVLFVTHDNL